MTTTHALAIAVPLWALATVAVARFLRYAKSDECSTCLHNEERAKASQIKGSYAPPSNTPPPPVPAPIQHDHEHEQDIPVNWPLKRVILLALAHRWHERADEANRAGDDRTRDLLDQCAMSLEREVRS